ncbi:MAG: dockerin type I repeat-containing protein [Prevotella sp.]|nr:dockerin type I repeat-containing protein [Alistipes senegalensis]MCM1357964.1 dockerin type I repeat-containing protein [Prevotella sp.]MCM1474147.1 dockerin type I repeat-containing protein [Muribaculaceae bacterium]
MKKLPVVLLSVAMLFSCVSLTAVADVQPESAEVQGDVNGDGIFNTSDVVLFQKWLLSGFDTDFINWSAADFYEDGKLDVFDLCLMKKELIEQTKPKLSENRYDYSLLKKYDNSASSQVSVFIQDDEALIMWKTPVFYEWKTPVFYEQNGCVQEIKSIDSCMYKNETPEMIEITDSDTVYYYGTYPKGYTYCVVKATAQGEATLMLDCYYQDRYIDFVIDEDLNISLKNPTQIIRS